MWIRPALAILLVFASLLPLGCSAQKVKAHPVQGKVSLKDGDVGILFGSNVELMQESAPDVRPSGKVGAGGEYTVETLYQGEIVKGAPEGTYKARIILGDESDEGVPKRKGSPIHRRYFDFETSGLKVTVPSGDYTINLSGK